MKKIIYILIAVLTFSGSFGIYKFRPFYSSVPLCEIKRNFKFYGTIQLVTGWDIHFTAYAEGSDASFENPDSFWLIDFQSGCVTGGIVDFSNSSEIRNNENFSKTLTELREKKLKPEQSLYEGFYVARVKITGKVEDTSRGIGGTDFHVEAKEIKQISPIRFLSQEDIQILREENSKYRIDFDNY